MNTHSEGQQGTTRAERLRRMHEIGDRIIGAKIVAVGESADWTIHLDFEHRGTDDDSGVMVVPMDNIRFHDEEAPRG